MRCDRCFKIAKRWQRFGLAVIAGAAVSVFIFVQVQLESSPFSDGNIERAETQLQTINTAVLGNEKAEAGSGMYHVNAPVQNGPDVSDLPTHLLEQAMAKHRKQEAIRSQYLGLTLAEAQQLAKQQGRRCQVGFQDGKSLPLTMDLVANRLTFGLEGGVVNYVGFENWPH